MLNVQNSNFNINFAKNENKKKQTYSQSPIQTSVSDTKEKSSNKGAKIAGITTGALGGGLLAGLAVASLIKGTPIISKGKINDLILDLGKKGRKLKNKEIKTGFETFMTTAIDKTQAAVNVYKSALNVTSLKDVGFKRITDKVPFVGKAFQKVTDVAEKISLNMVKKSYAKTNKQFNKLYAAFYDANATLPKSQAKSFEKEINNLRKNVINSFGAEETDFRLKNIKQAFDGIGEKIWDVTYKTPKKYLSSRGAYTNCLAEQITVPQKSKLMNSVNAMRTSITNTKKNDINSIKELLTNINSVLDPLADDTVNAMKKVDTKMRSFSKTNSPEAREALLESIRNLNNLVPDKEIQEIFAKNLETFTTPKSGQIQELLNNYKNVLPKKEYAKLEQAAQKAMNSLDKSVDLETSKLFEKMRDLEIGSAPTDVVSMLSTIGAVGYGLSRAKDKDERISAALKYGIPALGAVTVSLVCTTSLIAAGPSLGIGLLSGLLMNKAGEYADKIRKALSSKKENKEVK